MADQPITSLPVKTSSGMAATDYLLGIDSAEGYRMLIQDLGDYIIQHATSSLAGQSQTLASVISSLNNGNQILNEVSGSTASDFIKNVCTSLTIPNNLHPVLFSCTWTNKGYVSGFVRRVKTNVGYGGIFKLSMSSASDSKEFSFWSWDSVTFYADQIPTRAEIDTLNSNLMTAKAWTQFTKPTLDNGTHYGSHGCQYASFGSFVVVIISVVFNDPPTNAKLWTMPSGYKPVGVVEVPVAGGGSYNAKAQCTITDSGDVRVTSVDKWVAGQGIFVCGG